MLKRFSKFWWYLLIVGLVISGLGLLLLLDDSTSLNEIIQYLGYVLLGMGIVTIALNVVLIRKNHGDWRWYIVGIAAFALGILHLVEGDWASKTFIQIISFWAFMMGAYLLYVGFRPSSRSIPVTLAGLVSIAFASLVLFDSVTEAELHLIIGSYAVLFGAYLILMSLRIRKLPAGHSEKDGGTMGSN